MNAPFTFRTHRASGHERAGIVVWLVEFAAWRERISTLRHCLDASQRERASRLRDPMQRQDRELVHALHRLALSKFLDMPAACVPLGRSANGQPLLPGGDVHTSLSHANAHAAIAISTTGPVGVDIEPRFRNFAMADLADHICHPSELSISESGLLRLWVRKEAALKAIGTGLSIEMSSFAAPEGGLVSLKPDPLTARMTLQVRHVDAGVACVAAVAGSPGASVECRWLEPDREPLHGRATLTSKSSQPLRN